jgi:hypothetical protein
MGNVFHSWITVKYQENIFDVKISDHVINEIRTIDSEINILNVMDKKTLHAIQHLAEENHHAV